jgi:hypothetical protein
MWRVGVGLRLSVVQSHTDDQDAYSISETVDNGNERRPSSDSSITCTPLLSVEKLLFAGAVKTVKQFAVFSIPNYSK